ncbi:MAG TPA: hypothetical protein VJ063_03715, partial [Verrucomicrobiae bacterium]|nr:hypothetical protein [Verrucomicrobiae bacterium]
MNSRLTVTETVELFNQLKRTVRDCAAAEEKLTRELQTKTELAEKRFRQDLAIREKDLSEKLQQAEADFHSTRDQFQTRHKYWTGRISKARHASERLGFKRIDDAEGQRKHPLQKAVLDARRRREEEIKANEARLADFCTRLKIARDRFQTLYEEVKKTHHGVKSSSSVAAGEYEDEEAMLRTLCALNDGLAADLQRYRRLWMPKIFGAWFSNPVANAMHAAIAQCEQILVQAPEKAQDRKLKEAQRIEAETTAKIDRFDQEWRSTIEAAAAAREILPKQIEEKCWRLSVKTDQLYHDKQERLERDYKTTVERLKRDVEAAKAELTNSHKATLDKFKGEHQQQMTALVATWDQKVHPAYQALAAANSAAEEDFPPWQRELWRDWKPPEAFKTAVRFARLDLDLKKACGAVPNEPKLALPAASISVPLVLRYPNEGSVLFETGRSEAHPVISVLNAIIFRLLATSP